MDQDEAARSAGDREGERSVKEAGPPERAGSWAEKAEPLSRPGTLASGQGHGPAARDGAVQLGI